MGTNFVDVMAHAMYSDTLNQQFRRSMKRMFGQVWYERKPTSLKMDKLEKIIWRKKKVHSINGQRRNPKVTSIISGIDPKTNHYFDCGWFEWPDHTTAVEWRRNRFAIASNATSAAIKLNTAPRTTKKKEVKKDTKKKTVNSKEIRKNLPRQTAQV